MSRSYEIYPYSIDRLMCLLARNPHANKEVICTKVHGEYFENYFRELGAKTILIENNYVDRDFLDDFSQYYVRCFSQYERRCQRIHFFSVKIYEEDFDLFLGGLPC